MLKVTVNIDGEEIISEDEDMVLMSNSDRAAVYGHTSIMGIIGNVGAMVRVFSQECKKFSAEEQEDLLETLEATIQAGVSEL